MTAKPRLRHKLAVSAFALASLALACAPRPKPLAPMAPADVEAFEEHGVLGVELIGLENPTGAPVEVCLRDVIVTRPEGGPPACSYAEMGGCTLLRARSGSVRIAFAAPGPCPRVDVSQAVLVGDLRWRVWGSRAPWHSQLVLASPAPPGIAQEAPPR